MKRLALLLISLIILVSTVSGCNTNNIVPDSPIEPGETDTAPEKENGAEPDLVFMLPPTVGNLMASPKGHYLLFTVAAAPITPCYIVNTETYQGEICDERGFEWGQVEPLVIPDMEPAQIYYSDITPDGEKLLYIGYKVEDMAIPSEHASIYFGTLDLPPDMYHQVELDSEEVIGGIRPTWKVDQEGIYYLTAKGVMSYCPAEQQSTKIHSVSNLEGLIQNNRLAPHAFNLSDDFAELAYIYDGKIKLVPLTIDERELKVIDTGITDKIIKVEFIFDGRYLAIERESLDVEGNELSFLDRQTGDLVKFEADYLPSGYAWNDRDELVFFEGSRDIITLLDGNLEKVQSVDVPQNSRDVIWLDNMWCILGTDQDGGTPLYKVTF